MGELLQHALVTIVAFGAVAVIVRRVAGTFGSSRSAATPPCANCPSAKAHGNVSSPALSSDAKPLTFVR
jgi:hypothetical protein